MTVEDRNEIVGWLVLWTHWSIVGFENKSNHELLEMYDRLSKLNRG